MALSNVQETQILRLRAEGKSYAAIADEVNVAKQTAVDVCRRSKERLATLQGLELEQFYEAEKVTHKERIKALSSIMEKTRRELESRDLSDVPTEKLIDLYLKQHAALGAELLEPSFKSTEEQDRERSEREELLRLTQ